MPFLSGALAAVCGETKTFYRDDKSVQPISRENDVFMFSGKGIL